MKSQNVAIKFQCVVHRGLCQSLRQEMKRLQANATVDSEEFEEQIKAQSDLIIAHKQSLQVKDEKYSKLMTEYVKLKKTYNSQLSNMTMDISDENKENKKQKHSKYDKSGDDNVDSILKSLQDDKENLQNVNKQLRAATNVYRFRSVTHRKLQQQNWRSIN